MYPRKRKCECVRANRSQWLEQHDISRFQEANKNKRLGLSLLVLRSMKARLLSYFSRDSLPATLRTAGKAGGGFPGAKSQVRTRDRHTMEPHRVTQTLWTLKTGRAEPLLHPNPALREKLLSQESELIRSGPTRAKGREVPGTVGMGVREDKLQEVGGLFYEKNPMKRTETRAVESWWSEELS